MGGDGRRWEEMGGDGRRWEEMGGAERREGERRGEERGEERGREQSREESEGWGDETRMGEETGWAYISLIAERPYPSV
jgi:hypothetical protein